MWDIRRLGTKIGVTRLGFRVKRRVQKGDTKRFGV